MYDKSKRSEFETVKELKAMLEQMDENAKVYVCGLDRCFFHYGEGGTFICIDNESLEDVYEEDEEK